MKIIEFSASFRQSCLNPMNENEINPRLNVACLIPHARKKPSKNAEKFHFEF